MSEGSPKQKREESPREHKETPMRFKLPIELMLKANFSKIEMRGEENLKDLPPDAKVIFATTHISDQDVIMPVAKLGDRFRMKVVNASLQHDIRGHTIPNLGLRAMGIENTIPVDIKWGESKDTGREEYYSKQFNPENFLPMQDALEDGDAVVMAAYTPVPMKTGELPDKGGNGAVYLAEMSGAVIVPIAVHIRSEDPNMGMARTPGHSLKEKPVAEMIIGKPIVLEKIEGIEKFADLIENPGEGDARKENTVERKRIAKNLKAQSDVVMQSLADLLPEERKGKWGIQNNEAE